MIDITLFNRAAADIRVWPVSDIIYIAIVGFVMLAALLEWLLWLLAFVYCLVKVYQKADESKIATRVLAVIHIIIFVGMRSIFLPIMVVTLPLPPQAAQYFPAELVTILQWYDEETVGMTLERHCSHDLGLHFTHLLHC